MRDDNPLLHDITWTVQAGERWALLGPNGSGKTTLLRVAGSALWPTRGTVHILGERLGKVDMRLLRQRIAVVSAAVTRALRPTLSAIDVVLTGRHAALETWWNEYTDDDRAEADRLLHEAGFGGDAFDQRPFGLLSEGERQQVLLARALMGSPELVLMDEPAAGLDLGARERLIGRLAALAEDPAVPPLVLVTHHAEEIPPGVTPCRALARGSHVGVRAYRRGVQLGHGLGVLRGTGHRDPRRGAMDCSGRELVAAPRPLTLSVPIARSLRAVNRSAGWPLHPPPPGNSKAV